MAKCSPLIPHPSPPPLTSNLTILLCINYTITKAVHLPASGRRYQNQMSPSEFVIAEPVDFQDLKQAPGNESREQPLLLTSLRKKNQN